MTITGTPRTRGAAFVFGLVAGLWLQPRLPAADDGSLMFRRAPDVRKGAACQQQGKYLVHAADRDDVFTFDEVSCRKWRIWIHDDKRVRVKREVRG